MDDGKPMAECDGGCKTWVHIKCHKLKLGEDFYCDKCTEGVQTSKSDMQQDDPVSEPMADSDAEDDDHTGSGPGPGGAALEEEAVPALVSRKSKAVSRSPTPDAAAGFADNSPDTGAEKTSLDCEKPEGAAAKDPEGIPSSKKKNKKVCVLKTAALLAVRLAFATAHHNSSPGSTHCLTLCLGSSPCRAGTHHVPEMA